MRSQEANSSLLNRVSELPWGRWYRQILAILRLELKRNLFSTRAIPIYLLAVAPLLLFGARVLVPLPARVVNDLGGSSVAYAIMYRSFFLRFAVFFGCVGIFMNLFRGELLEKSLHYYFLTPLRREVLVIGKYLSGLVIAAILFGGSAVLSYLLLYAPSGVTSAREYLLMGPGLAHLGAYLGVTVLACLGYGSVFLAMGLFFRNPIIPAVVILGWESINFLLPPMLKKISVIHYLESLCPVPVPQGSVTILADPASAWVGVPGLLCVTATVLVIASLLIRRMEITYSNVE